MHQKLPLFLLLLKEFFFFKQRKTTKDNLTALGAVNSQFMLHGGY